MLNLLILSCGTNASYHMSKILKEKFNNDFYLIGADVNESWLVPSINFLDKFYKVPYLESPEYLPTIEKILCTEKVDYILPSLDSDQSFFHSSSAVLKKYSVKTLSTPVDSLLIYKNKLTMGHFLISNGFDVPKIYLREECKDDTLYFIKPLCGLGSVGAESKKGCELKDIDDGKYIIQELCIGPEITMECFSYGSFFSCICRERLATKSGVCVKARVFKDSYLEFLGKKFATTLKTPHYFNLQFMKNSQDKYVITDVNLRSAGGMGLSYAAGWDVTSSLANIMLNKTLNDICQSLPNDIQEQFVVRTYVDIVTKKSKKVVAFDLDGTLLDSRARHIIVLKRILQSKNIKIDVSNLIQYKRNGKNNVDFMLEEGIDISTAEEIQDEWIKNIENDEALQNDTLYSHAIELLEKYNNSDRVLITARNNEENLKRQLKQLEIEKYFKAIYVVAANKQTSQSKSQILQEIGAVLYIGDTLSDYNAAKKANIDFIHQDNGFHCSHIISKHKNKEEVNCESSV